MPIVIGLPQSSGNIRPGSPRDSCHHLLMAPSAPDPIRKFIRWFDDAQRAKIPTYEAMALATADSSGKTSVRFVLLKKVDDQGFVFFTDNRSHKGRDLRANSHAALAFYWDLKRRQVRVEGKVEEVSAAESDAYWPTRPRQSRIAANASHQSAPLRSRAKLLAECARLNRKFRRQEVPRPSYWIGYRVRPDAIEFWTHRDHRLHEREIYLRRPRGWQRGLLQP
jgi:pyridoxamine 5'-phosphate oxidase